MDRETRELSRRDYWELSPEDQTRALRGRDLAGELTVGCGVCGGRGFFEPSPFPDSPRQARYGCVGCGGSGPAFGTGRVSAMPLLAFLAHEPARVLAQGGEGPPLPCGCYRPRGTWPPCQHTQSMSEWLGALLSRWHQDVVVRAAVAAARTALPEWAEEHAKQAGHLYVPEGFGPNGEYPCCYAPTRVILAAEAWLECPCEKHRGLWDRTHGTAHSMSSATGWEPALGQERESIETAHGVIDVRVSIQEELVTWVLGST